MERLTHAELLLLLAIDSLTRPADPNPGESSRQKESLFIYQVHQHQQQQRQEEQKIKKKNKREEWTRRKRTDSIRTVMSVCLCVSYVAFLAAGPPVESAIDWSRTFLSLCRGSSSSTTKKEKRCNGRRRRRRRRREKTGLFYIF